MHILKLWDRISVRRDVLDTTLCDNVCQWLAAGRWFSPGTLVSFTNKTDSHDITEILLKVVLNTINLTLKTVMLILPILKFSLWNASYTEESVCVWGRGGQASEVDLKKGTSCRSGPGIGEASFQNWQAKILFGFTCTNVQDVDNLNTFLLPC